MNGPTPGLPACHLFRYSLWIKILERVSRIFEKLLFRQFKTTLKVMINSTWNWWNMLLMSTFTLQLVVLYERHHLNFRPGKDISFCLLENTSYFHFVVCKVEFYSTLTENFVFCFLTNIIKHDFSGTLQFLYAVAGLIFLTSSSYMSFTFFF